MYTHSSITDETAVLTPEQLVDVASSTTLNIDVMSPNAGVTRARHLRGAGGWSVDVADLGGHVRAAGALHPGTIAILSVQRTSDATICRVPMQQDMMLVIPAGHEITASILPRLQYTTVVLPVERWVEIGAAATGREIPVPTSPFAIRVPSDKAARVSGLPESLAAASSLPLKLRKGELPAPLVSHLSSVAELLAEAEGHSPVLHRGQQHRIRQAWLACDYIHAHLDEVITIERLCREAGASRRQLEYAFRSVFGVAPHEFVELARLNECRRRLRSAREGGSSITRIAMEAGFTHLSRFAGSYRRLFGELPSETLRLAGRI